MGQFVDFELFVLEFPPVELILMLKVFDFGFELIHFGFKVDLELFGVFGQFGWETFQRNRLGNSIGPPLRNIHTLYPISI